MYFRIYFVIVPEDKVKFQALCANLQATMAVLIRNMPVAEYEKIWAGSTAKRHDSSFPSDV
jgi:hypothetical protein